MPRESVRAEEGYVDPRMLRSRQALHTAVLALAAERDLVDISIGDITLRAKVNRATFYLHYREKDCLLADAMNTALTSEVNASDEYDAPKAEAGQSATPRQLVTYFRHIDRYRAVYRRALGPQGSAFVITQVRESLEQATSRELRSSSPLEGDVPVWLRAAYIAGALMGVVTAWVRTDEACTPESIAYLAWQMLTTNHPTDGGRTEVKSSDAGQANRAGLSKKEKQ